MIKNLFQRGEFYFSIISPQGRIGLSQHVGIVWPRIRISFKINRKPIQKLILLTLKTIFIVWKHFLLFFNTISRGWNFMELYNIFIEIELG